MKRIILLSVLLISITGISQTKRTETFNETYGGIQITQTKVEEADKEALSFIMLSFNNQKYQHISDLKYISLRKKEDIDNLILNFNNAIEFLNSKEKSSMEFKDDTSKYTIYADGKSGSIMLWSYTKTSGYCFVTQKNIAKIVTALKTLSESYKA